jgi:protein-disulfide isomerase
MVMAAAFGVGAALLVIVVGAVLRDDGGSAVEHVGQRDGRSLGSPTAPVNLYAWEDFQCPHCKDANRDVLARIETEYVRDGRVAIHYRNFPFLGDGSVIAAEAAECAAEQGQFWEYHDILFANQSASQFTLGEMKGFAAELPLDQAAFGRCVDEGRYRATIADEHAEGLAAGVQSTPTFFINGEMILGARPYEFFQVAIESALAGD